MNLLTQIFSILKLVLKKVGQPFRWYWKLSRKKKLIVGGITFLGTILLGFLALLGFYYAVAWGMFGKMPTDEELLHIKNFEASEVYSADSVLIGRYFVENRSDVKYEAISENIIDALVATEDVRFYEHEGVDHKSLMRVLFKSIILGQHKGGGSTITQQVVKNLFGRKDRGLLTMPINKTREAIIANQLEKLYSKQEILTMYLNTVSFGEDTYGIRVACERYFSTSPATIALQDAAVLVGMLKAPSYYNPRKNPENALKRRNVVLHQMEKYEYISPEKYDSLKVLPIALEYHKVNQELGSAPYLREKIRVELEKWLVEQGGEYDLYTDGLKIYTTIDSRMQKYAEEAVGNHLKVLQPQLYKELRQAGSFNYKNQLFKKYLLKTALYKALKSEDKDDQQILTLMSEAKETQLFTYDGVVDTLISPIDSLKHMMSVLQAGFMVTNPKNGDVLAWVGGPDYNTFQYDHIMSKRQVGSVFKPIIYSKALIDGKKPCDFILNQEIHYAEYDNWTPHNAGGEKFEGKYSLVGALTNSVNTISVKLCMESGIDNVIDFAHKLGVEDSLPRVPSLALGVADLSLYQLLHVYTTFANKGSRAKFQYISGICNNKSDTIYRYEVYTQEVLDSTVVNDMTNMLRSVVNEGTAARLRSVYGFDDDIAGKTGTTQDQTDGWFVGYTPTFLGGVWVGADDPSIHFQSLKYGQGANVSLPIWALFYQKMRSDESLSSWVGEVFSSKETFACEHYKELSGLQKLFTRKEKTERRKGYKQKKRFRLFGKKK